ncbi:hypothetical protein Mx9_p05 [Myxococcus phage Mx9]|nr:hypothetical protein Mx9_p05 [Myxococcus phage Mx9]
MGASGGGRVPVASQAGEVRQAVHRPGAVCIDGPHQAGRRRPESLHQRGPRHLPGDRRGGLRVDAGARGGAAGRRRRLTGGR